MTARRPVRFLDRTTPPHIMTLVLMAGLSAMNMSIFLPSLPGLTAYFDTSYATMQIAVSGYLATTAVLQLIIGPLSDRYGRRPVVMGGFAVFLLATLGCILAPTEGAFLFFRLMQGAVAVGLVLSRAIVRDMVPQNEAASMIGYVTMGMALVPMLAPPIGGALDLWAGWQAVCVFLLIFGSGLLVLLYFDLGETAVTTSTSFAAQVRDYPELLQSHRFWGYVFAAAFASGAFFAFLGGAPYVASTVFGLDPFWAGIGMGAPAIGYAFGNFLTGRLAVRFGINALVLWGCIITAGGLTLSTLWAILVSDSPLPFFGFFIFVGIGNGLVMPNATAGMLSVRPHLAGTASGLGAAIMIGGGAALSAVASSILTPDGGSLPLLTVMLTSASLAVLSMLYVLRRERVLASAPTP